MDEGRTRRMPVLLVLLLGCMAGFIVGITQFITGDSWVNGTNYIRPNASWSENVNVTGNLTVSGRLVCLQDGTNCPASSGNASWNQSHANTLYYAISNPWGYYNTSTIPAYLTTETDPLYRSNTSNICWSNGTNCQSQSVTVPVMNITYKPAFREILFGSPAGGTINGLSTTARCSSFPVEKGTQVIFDNIKLMVDTTNSTIGAFFAIYNCTSNNKFDCTTGTIHKVNTSRFSFGSSAMQGVTNTTGNWTLVEGNYVMCTMTNTSNSQASTFRGVTGSSGTGSTLRLSVTTAFPTSATFTASEADVVPYVFLYREAGVK